MPLEDRPGTILFRNNELEEARRRFADIIARLKPRDSWLSAGDRPGLYVTPWKPIGKGHRARFEVTYPDTLTRLSVAYVAMPERSALGPGLRIEASRLTTPAGRWTKTLREPCDEDIAARYDGPWPDVVRQDEMVTDLDLDHLLGILIEVYAAARAA